MAAPGGMPPLELSSSSSATSGAKGGVLGDVNLNFGRNKPPVNGMVYAAIGLAVLWLVLKR